MHLVHIGYSNNLTSDEIISYFDIDPSNEEGLSRFAQDFGERYVEPGSFEVYGKNDYEGYKFDISLLKQLFPFTPDEQLLKRIDFNNVKCVFFIETDCINNNDNDDLVFLGSMNVDKYDFEN